MSIDNSNSTLFLIYLKNSLLLYINNKDLCQPFFVFLAFASFFIAMRATNRPMCMLKKETQLASTG